MEESRSLVCEPIAKPDWLEGNLVIYTFTPEILRWLLATRRLLEQGFGNQAETTFNRAYFSVAAGDWLREVPDCKDMEFDGEWLEPPRDSVNTLVASEDVPTHSWTIGIGVRDILFQFQEDCTGEQLETPELTYGVLEALLRDLHPGQTWPASATESPRSSLQRLADLRIIAGCYQRALNMSDSSHGEFADSASDVVEYLWTQAELVRKTLAAADVANIGPAPAVE